MIYDPYASEEAIRKEGYYPVPLDDLLRNSDIVSLHLPLNESTSQMIDARALSKMRSDAYLVNTSRGMLVDEKAVYKALLKGKLAGVALDVYQKEPVEKGNPLLALSNVILTPHNAAICAETNYQAGITAAHSIISVYNGGRPDNPI